jgi:peptidoglycan/LPS O-acetylase OafA/YrhL
VSTLPITAPSPAVPVAERGAATAPRAGRRHVYEADVVRVLTFAAVIGVHTIAQTNGNSSVGANGVVMLLHFTRNAFFALTGFVLAYQYLGRRYSLGKFWYRRFLTVGVPYVVWTLFYTGLQWFQGARNWTLERWWIQLRFYLIHGDAWFHLYFLLVSMQVYLLYPLIAALVRATARHHVTLLVISLAVQVTTSSVLTYGHFHGGPWGWYAGYSPILVFTYQFYVLLGAVTAAHLEEIASWIRSHTKTILAALVVTGAAAEIWYVVATRHQEAATAADVLQPIMLPWSVAVVAGLMALGLYWSDHRRAGSRFDQFMGAAQDRSFGIYLCHPAVLFGIVWAGNHYLYYHLTGPELALVVYPLTVLGAVVVTEVLRHVPFSTAFTGRARLPLRRATSAVDSTRATRTSSTTSTTTGKDTSDARNRVEPADARLQAPPAGHDDGDRQRPADPSVHRHSVELQRAD